MILYKPKKTSAPTTGRYGAFALALLASGILYFRSPLVQAETSVVVVPPPWEAAEKGTLSEDDLIFHGLDGRNYNESWFFQCHLDDGSVLIINLSVTNAGLRKWDSSVDLWIRRDGEVLTSHREVSAKRLAFDRKVREVRIGGTTFRGAPPLFRLEFAEKDLKGTLSIDLSKKGGSIPADRTIFDGERTQFSAFTILALGAELSGHLRIEGTDLDISGEAYVNHHLATVLPPQYCTSWYSFVAFHEDLTLYVALKELTGGTDTPPWRYLAVLRKGRLVLLTHEFEMDPVGFRTHGESGQRFATGFTIRAEGKETGLALKGRFDLEEEYLWIDVFQHLGSVTRWLIKTFYTKAWNQRCSYRYTLAVEPTGGPASEVTGVAVGDNSFFE